MPQIDYIFPQLMSWGGQVKTSPGHQVKGQAVAWRGGRGCHLQWTTTGPASTMLSCLWWTSSRKSSTPPGSLGTPWSGQVRKWYCQTVLSVFPWSRAKKTRKELNKSRGWGITLLQSFSGPKWAEGAGYTDRPQAPLKGPPQGFPDRFSLAPSWAIPGQLSASALRTQMLVLQETPTWLSPLTHQRWVTARLSPVVFICAPAI